MKTIRILPVIILACLPALSIADEDAKVDAAKQTAAEACMKEAQERYDSASAISDVQKYNKNGTRGYYIDLKVGKTKKKVRCIAKNNGKIMITSK